jgi:hypothetical protein
MVILSRVEAVLGSNPDFSSNLPAERGQAADNKGEMRPTVAGGRKTVCRCDKGRMPRSVGLVSLPGQAS